MMSVCSARSTMRGTGACWATSRRRSHTLHWRTRPLHSPANGSPSLTRPASNDCDATSSVGEGLYLKGTLRPNHSTGYLQPSTARSREGDATAREASAQRDLPPATAQGLHL